MNILLVGYGKMGKAIERVAVERGHTIAGRVDIDSPAGSIKRGADVAIEFTQPASAVGNIKRCLDAGIPVVCGTTGWLKQLEEVTHHCTKTNGAVFYSSNFSLGVNIFFKVNEYLARLMEQQGNYAIELDETHHTEKKDAPSGTAISLAEGIMKNLSRKKRWVNQASDKADDLVINSFRKDPAPGTHVVRYSSAIDDIEIKHTAHSREGFARGAVLVAEWIKDKKGILTMDNFLTF